MITRRRFLSASTMAVTALGLCRPAAGSLPVSQKNSISPYDHRSPFLKKRHHLLAQRDPCIFLGYPLNMNPAPDGMIRWCRELEKAGFGIQHTNNVGHPFYHKESWP